MKLLDDRLQPDCRRMYPNEDYVFQQDSARLHISRAIQSFGKTVFQVSLKMDGLPSLRIAIPWITVYGTRFLYSGRTTVFKEEELKNAIREKYLRMKSERRFYLGKNGCEQLPWKRRPH